VNSSTVSTLSTLSLMPVFPEKCLSCQSRIDNDRGRDKPGHK